MRIQNPNFLKKEFPTKCRIKINETLQSGPKFLKRTFIGEKSRVKVFSNWLNTKGIDYKQGSSNHLNEIVCQLL